MRHRILIADDNKDAADSLSLLLSLYGHEVSAVYTGADALETAEKERPDLIFLDIGMPDLDGYEIAERLRRMPWGSEVKLVAATGYGRPEDVRRALEAGFDHHLVKPLAFERLTGLLA